MIFKFGLLVVLLVFYGVLAAEQQQRPTLLDVEIVSYAQQLKSFSILSLRMHHLAVPSPLSSSINSLTSSTGRTCSWYPGIKECSVSLSTIKHLLESSSTGLAKISFEDLDCLDQDSKGFCNIKRSCLWDKELNECEYSDLKRGHEDSPCAKAAPVFFNLLEASTKCGKQGSKWSCGSTNHCQWYSKQRYCRPDTFFYLTGIEDFDNKMDQVFDLELDAVADEYDALRNSSDFTWGKYLYYEPSRITCPSGVESLVCKYVDTFFRHCFGSFLYCRERFRGSPPRCNADTLCAWDTASAKCDVDESQKSLLSLPTTKVLVDAMPDGVDKTYYDNVFTCAATIVKGSCKGNCIWNHLSRECKAKSNLLANLMAESLGDITDGLCKFIKVVYSAPCHSKFTKHDCHNAEFCVWDSNAGCLRQPELLVSAAADLDPSMKSNYTRVKKHCSGHHTSVECVADYIATSRIKISP